MRKNRVRRFDGSCLIALGIVLILASAALFFYNQWDEDRADKASKQILDCVPIVVPAERRDNPPAHIPAYPSQEVKNTPAYILNPGMDMPIVKTNNGENVGVVTIPSLKIELPILNKWSYPNLKIAPCRVTGTAYMNNLVIAGHNYRRHFGSLKRLKPGDAVFFQDMDKNVFEYTVSEVAVLPPTAEAVLKQGGWDMTLFTCTYSGRTRLTVRCRRTA